MTLDELELAFQNIANADSDNAYDDAAQQIATQPDAEPPAPYLTYENVDRDFGNWYNHNKDIGTMLMEQLRANGVDTRDATEAALREILTDITSRLEILTETFSMFKSKVDELAQQTEKVTSAVTDTLHSAGTTVSPDTSGALPDAGMGVMPDMNAGTTVSPDTSGALPDAGMGVMPDMNTGTEMPLPDAGVDVDGMTPGTNTVISDDRLKKIKADLLTRKKQPVVSNTVVSDVNAKKVKGSLIDPSIAAICSWRK